MSEFDQIQYPFRNIELGACEMHGPTLEVSLDSKLG
jgi:hypothetical protein